MYLGLVKEGFVVLAYDPVGQGERRYYWDPATNANEIGGPVTWEHSLPGQLLLLIGQDLTHYRIWDGMRAIDYLLTRPEVDPQRIGCCGQSGGGTLTTFISALDERVKCAAAHEGGMHRRWPVHIRPETTLGTGRHGATFLSRRHLRGRWPRSERGDCAAAAAFHDRALQPRL